VSVVIFERVTLALYSCSTIRFCFVEKLIVILVFFICWKIYNRGEIVGPWGTFSI